MKTKFKSFYLVLTLFISIGWMTSCSSDDEIKVVDKFWSDDEKAILKQHFGEDKIFYDYMIEYPYYLGFGTRSMDSKKASLGRIIFYDKNLSEDKKISCASCHKPEIGFSDNVAFSTGIQNRVTSRNSIALGSSVNFAAYYGEGRVPFFWDNRVNTVQDQSKQTFANDNEMGVEMHEVAAEVNKQPYYKPIIKKVFGRETATQDEILDALAEFTNSITHFNSKFDRVLDFKNNFNSEEDKGFKLYRKNCSSCHGFNLGAPGFFEANNGLTKNYTDYGTGTNDATAKFKVPTLRNVMLTAPYMHDGSLATIDDVLNHYSNGIQNHASLHFNLKDGANPKKFNFSEADKNAFKAFFLTLTDETTSKEIKFISPFL
jgi:cytochrome c peroxidase